tara:strand:+ start:1330 stop:1857 length:528 start_codon:yes stop_codon:yes gene_type:complete
MDKLINDAEAVDLSKENILEITNNGCDVVVYHNLGDYNSLENLLGDKGAVILLYETKQNFGHWVALFYTDSSQQEIEFFDSYGFKPDEELNYAKYDDQPYITELIQKSNKKIIYNTKKLQTFKEDINTCGRWTSLRIAMREVPLQKFQYLFKNNKSYNGDWFVSALTYIFTHKNQ